MTRESRLTFRSLLLLSISALCWLALPSPARAQAVAIAQVAGNVTDPTGGAIANAQVRMIETERQAVHATVTNAQGQYVLPGLPVGPYRLEVRVSGFKDYAQTGIVLQVNNNVQINVAMQVGSLSEKVEVSATASMVETKENSISSVVDQRGINDLPLNGRQATQLIMSLGAAFPSRFRTPSRSSASKPALCPRVSAYIPAPPSTWLPSPGRMRSMATSSSIFGTAI
jgi:hypothetical protein